MVNFQNEVINNGNEEQILFGKWYILRRFNLVSLVNIGCLLILVVCFFVSVRRSGRLSSQRPRIRDNVHYETIDLTIDGDSEEEQGISETKFVFNVYKLNMMHVDQLHICLKYVVKRRY